MNEQHARTARMLGEKAVERLNEANVLLFGVGGVGSFAAEALARAGVGSLTLVDGDEVALSNLNRQLVALHSTLGMPKAQAMAERIRDINPECRVEARVLFYGRDTAQEIDFTRYDYVIDAIDSVASKVMIAEACTNLGVPLISCMGAGNKLDPTRFEVQDLSKTSVCPLARVMRQRLGKLGIHHLKVVYSQEPPVTPRTGEEAARVPGSVSFVPSVAGLILAGEAIKDLISLPGEEKA